jgi:hypothetical protein
MYIRWQRQRAGNQLLHRDTKTASSPAALPLPEVCATAQAAV